VLEDHIFSIKTGKGILPNVNQQIVYGVYVPEN